MITRPRTRSSTEIALKDLGLIVAQTTRPVQRHPNDIKRMSVGAFITNGLLDERTGSLR